MSTDLVEALLQKRAEPVAGRQVGGPKRRPRVFAHGELIALIGEAERGGPRPTLRLSSR